MNDWNIYGEYYDSLYEDYHEDLEFWKTCWDPSWESVMEIGTGTGRFISLLKEIGVKEYVGLDTAIQMLNQIPKEYASECCQWFCKDLLDFETKKHFDLIIYTFNTFSYILSLEQAAKHLLKCKALLNEKGLIAIDFTSYDRTYSEEEFAAKKDNTAAVVEYDYKYDPVEMIETRYLKYIKDGQVVDKWQLDRRRYISEEILKIAESVGLAIHKYEKTEIALGKYNTSLFLKSNDLETVS